MNSRRFVFLFLFSLVAVAVLLYVLLEQIIPKTVQIQVPRVTIPQVEPKNNQTEIATVKRVVDGDTIELQDGKKVRYIGINTPETNDPRRSVECFGKEAKVENQRLVEGKMVRLEKDVSDTDKYGRLLRYVYVEDVMINEYLVKEGYAHMSTYPPDVRYVEKFQNAQKTARLAKRGLWNACPNQ